MDIFSGEFREDVTGAKQTVRSQVIDCFFTKLAKDVLKKEQRTVSWRRRLGAREERRHWRSDARSQPREIRDRSLAASATPKARETPTSAGSPREQRLDHEKSGVEVEIATQSLDSRDRVGTEERAKRTRQCTHWLRRQRSGPSAELQLKRLELARSRLRRLNHLLLGERAGS